MNREMEMEMEKGERERDQEPTMKRQKRYYERNEERSKKRTKHREMPCFFDAILLRTCSRLNGFLIVDYIIIMTRIKRDSEASERERRIEQRQTGKNNSRIVEPNEHNKLLNYIIL